MLPTLTAVFEPSWYGVVWVGTVWYGPYHSRSDYKSPASTYLPYSFSCMNESSKKWNSTECRNESPPGERVTRRPNEAHVQSFAQGSYLLNTSESYGLSSRKESYSVDSMVWRGAIEAETSSVSHGIRVASIVNPDAMPHSSPSISGWRSEQGQGNPARPVKKCPLQSRQ